MRVLAIDTSTAVTAVAVVDGARVLAEDDTPSEDRHGDVLLPRVRAVLARAQLPLSAMELLAVGIGPGSFTGLRIGLASAKGLALGVVHAPALRGVCSLRALAAGIGAPEQLRVAAFDAGKGEVFAAVFELVGGVLQARLPPVRALPDEAAERIAAACTGAATAGAAAELASRSIAVAGSGARRHPQLLAALGARAELCAPEHDAPRGRFVAQEALALLRLEGPSDLASLEPSYLRDSL